MILALPLLLAAWKLKDETLKRIGLSFVVLVGLLGYAAYLGGQIHHPETRAGFTAPAGEQGK